MHYEQLTRPLHVFQPQCIDRRLLQVLMLIGGTGAH